MAKKRTLGDSERVVGAALAVGRIAIGAGIWAAPGLTAKALGMKAWDGEALAVARIAATRDVILGAWLGSEIRDGGKPLAPAMALVACDAGDTVAFALLAARGGESVKPGVLGLSAAGPATAVGAWLVNRLRS
jgi:hypothetical protein